MEKYRSKTGMKGDNKTVKIETEHQKSKKGKNRNKKNLEKKLRAK
jgi:hypothetical protein